MTPLAHRLAAAFVATWALRAALGTAGVLLALAVVGVAAYFGRAAGPAAKPATSLKRSVWSPRPPPPPPTFAESNYKKLIRTVPKCPKKRLVKAAAQQLIAAYGGTQAATDELLQEASWVKQRVRLKIVSSATRSETEKTMWAAMRLWTSPAQLHTRVGTTELCSLLNHAIREDSSATLAHAIVLVRAVELFCLKNPATLQGFYGSAARMLSSSRWPNGRNSDVANTTFRGGSLPAQHHAFFEVGRSFRSRSFLSTTYHRQVAEEFMQRARHAAPAPQARSVCGISPRRSGLRAPQPGAQRVRVDVRVRRRGALQARQPDQEARRRGQACRRDGVPPAAVLRVRGPASRAVEWSGHRPAPHHAPGCVQQPRHWHLVRRAAISTVALIRWLSHTLTYTPGVRQSYASPLVRACRGERSQEVAATSRLSVRPYTPSLQGQVQGGARTGPRERRLCSGYVSSWRHPGLDPGGYVTKLCREMT